MYLLMIKVIKGCIRTLYRLMRIFPTRQGKVLFLSRQTNGPSLDFRLIQEQLKQLRPDAKVVSICVRADGGLSHKVKFVWGMVRSIFHLATTRVCVLDSYWPIVSLINKPNDLTVIQIWHALGKLKQSGYQALDKEGGRNGDVARALCMHRNYDWIIAGGKAWNPYYCASFDVKEDILVNIGLPRIDYLLGQSEEKKRLVYEKYPEFLEKPMVLYAPTFRRNAAKGWDELLKEFDFKKYHLVIKPHPNQILSYDDKRVYSCDEFPTIDLVASCEYLITDYSSISLEAAILNKKTLYYVYDYEDYMANNGMNLDIVKELPHSVFFDAKSLGTALREGNYDEKELQNFRKNYLPEDMGHSAEKIAGIICNHLEVTKHD